ncbi:MAG: hypothetical protein ACTSRS_05540 [Candidatus Helarchaeota archaeon]
MRETIELFKNVIRHPGRTVEPLQEKPLTLGFILLIINIVMTGALFGYSKFWMDPGTVLFWILAPAFGIIFAIFFGIFEGLYYSISKFLLKEDQKRDLRLIGGYFLIAFTLYHILSTIVNVILISLHEYYIAVWFWDVSHAAILFWIAALCVQALQKIREETEFRTMLKVFFSLFGAYCLQQIIFLILSQQVINLIYR